MRDNLNQSTQWQMPPDLSKSYKYRGPRPVTGAGQPTWGIRDTFMKQWGVAPIQPGSGYPGMDVAQKLAGQMSAQPNKLGAMTQMGGIPKQVGPIYGYVRRKPGGYGF